MNPDPTELQPLEQLLGHEFRDASLLRLAITHPSASGNQSKPSDDNQRMEFLGDAILQAVISEALYRLHPDKDEGHLTKARAGLVNGTMLAAKATALGLERSVDAVVRLVRETLDQSTVAHHRAGSPNSSGTCP